MSTPAAFPAEGFAIFGREQERSRLATLLDSACTGAGSLVLIGGPAGIGKTTLIEQTVQDATERGMLVLSGSCYDLTTTPPYGPWAEMLSTYPGNMAELPPVPQTLRASERLEDVGSHEQFFDIIARFVEEAAAARPLVLILEDLHWSDAASIELLRYLARRVSRQRILTLVSYRNDELARTHPLFSTLPLLIREARAERIDLQAFDAATVRAVVTSRYQLQLPDGERLGSYLIQHTEGNPLFLMELLRSLEAERVLDRAHETWQLGDLDAVAPPPLVVQMIERQLALLEVQAREAIEDAAVLGHEFMIDRWQQIAELSDEALATTLEQAFEARVFEQRGSQRLQFRHALIRDVLYHGIPFPRRRLIHRRVGEMLVEAGSADPDIIADHFQRAGDSRAVDWLIEAGERAARTFADFAAAERFEAALRLLENDEDSVSRHGWLCLALAMNGRESLPERTHTAIEQARRIAAMSGDRALSAWTLWISGQNRFFIGQNGLVEIVDGLAAIRHLSPDERAQVPPHFQRLDTRHFDATIALVLSIVGQYPTALRTAEEFLTRDPPDTAMLWNERAHAESARAHALSAVGNPAQAAEAYRRTRDAYRNGHNIWFAALNAPAELQYVTLRYQTDDLANRDRLAQETEALWTQANDTRHGFPARFGLLPLLLVEGAWSEARALAEPFANRDLIPHHFALFVLGTIAWRQGDTTLAWQQVEKGLPNGPETEPGTAELLFTRELHELQHLAADLALDSGDLRLAARWIQANERWLTWSGSVLGQADVRLLWARYHQIAGDILQARHEAELSLALASGPRQPLALVAAHRMLGQIDRVEQRYDGAQAHLDIALDLATRCAAPFEQALTLLVLAELGAATGQIDAAWAQLDQLRSICTPLGATPTLQKAAAIAAKLSVRRGKPFHPFGLTPREVDVLRLIAQGLTDAEAADRLFVSPRTVNTHLTAVYGKLGVSTRSAATRIAVEHGLTDIPAE